MIRKRLTFHFALILACAVLARGEPDGVLNNVPAGQAGFPDARPKRVAGGEARGGEGAALGDWGHFLSYTPTLYFNNPQGVPFTITVRVMRWANRDWNPGELTLRLVSPDGSIVADGPQKLTRAAVTIEVKEAVEGVYRLHSAGREIWVGTSLPQAVAWTGHQGTDLLNMNDPVTGAVSGKPRRREYHERRGPLVFHANVPRRWWFWVPPEVTSFTAEALRDQWTMSQREDWGFFIISPRGQRVRALWGQPENRSHASGEYHRRQRVEVEVEPGAGGRFWSLEVSLGDSHHHSNINIAFDGIPPYLARSPEEWFDPRTGRRPAPEVYDDSPFIQAAPIEGTLSFQELHHKVRDADFVWTDALRRMQAAWPHLEHFSPCPSLGDPDGIEILGDARFALWNPDGRDLRFRVGSYITRKGGKTADPEMAAVTVVGADGTVVFDKMLPVQHIHDPKTSGPTDTLRTGEGVATVSVSGAERWFSFTYPATPLVLIGAPSPGSGREDAGEWSRFRFTACAPRNWYFLVPAGTESFALRFAADLPTDILHLEICAPDRVMALLYANRGEQTVTVPPGLDGKIWYLRPSIGGATRIVTEDGPDYRHQDLPLTLELKGVPGYLAPTWEQWFDPREPRQARVRDARDASAAPLRGRRVAVLVAEGFQDAETLRPITHFRALGAEVSVIGTAPGVVKAYNSDARVAVEAAVGGQDAGAFDALIIPGGHSPGRLLEVPGALAFVRAFVDSGRPVGAICHGPMLLAAAGTMKGRTATGVAFPQHQIVVETLGKAGATFVDREVVRDGNIVTSRLPNDLPAFLAALEEMLRQ